MNVWTVIKNQLEKETGKTVVSLPDANQTISTGQIILLITSVGLTTNKDRCYEVDGDLIIKSSHQDDWHALTELLDMGLTGTRATATMTTYEGGFTGMSIGFKVYVRDHGGRNVTITEVEYDD